MPKNVITGLPFSPHVTGRRFEVVMDIIEIRDQVSHALRIWAYLSRSPQSWLMATSKPECCSASCSSARRRGILMIALRHVRAFDPVPIHDDAIDAAADHVLNLPVYLARIGRIVADIDVRGVAPPRLYVNVNLCVCAGIEQIAQWQLAHRPRSRIAIRAARKLIACTGIVCRLGGKRGRGHNIDAPGRCNIKQTNDQQQSANPCTDLP